MSWHAEFLRQIGLPDQVCWERSVHSCTTTFGFTALLFFRCANKAHGRRDPKGRSGGAAYVWTMGHCLWWWLDWSWCWGSLPAVGIQVCASTVNEHLCLIHLCGAEPHCIQLGALKLPNKLRILPFKHGGVPQPHRQPVLPRSWPSWPPTVTATRVAAYLMMWNGEGGAMQILQVVPGQVPVAGLTISIQFLFL